MSQLFPFPALARAETFLTLSPLVVGLRWRQGRGGDGHWWWVSAAVPPPCPLSSESRNVPEITEHQWLPLCVKSGRLELSLGRTDAPGYGADGSPVQGGARLLTSPRAFAPEAESKAERGVEAHRSSTICSHGVVQSWSAGEAVPFLK